MKPASAGEDGADGEAEGGGGGKQEPGDDEDDHADDGDGRVLAGQIGGRALADGAEISCMRALPASAASTDWIAQAA